MSHALSTVVSTVASIFGLVFLIWLFIRWFRSSGEPVKLIIQWVATAVVIALELTIAFPAFARGGLTAVYGLGLTMALAIVINIIWRNAIIELVAKPFTSLYDGGNEEVEPKPQYSIAQAKRNRKKPLEAIVAIREQLAKFPNDFEGVLLLANIQAEDLNDLPGAEITLNNFCNSPDAPDRQVVAALSQLADWHLKKALDVEAARVVLQQIVERVPNTDLSLRAQQRLAHLDGTGKVLMDARDRQAMPVPEGVDNIGLLDSTAFLQPKEEDPGQLAMSCLKQLEAHPHDSEVREKLATLYARDYKRLDLATLELEQLINEPRHSPKQIAGWLNLLANFQVELGADAGTVTATLEQVVERFPNLPAADLARRRLARVKLEIKGQQETSSVKLGVYEQNIGLKYGSPRKR